MDTIYRIDNWLRRAEGSWQAKRAKDTIRQLTMRGVERGVAALKIKRKLYIKLKEIKGNEH